MSCDELPQKMTFPCTVCGTILQIDPNTEFVFCTMCGTRIDIGVHSYHSVSDTKHKIYCINCNLNLDPVSTGRIFSCNNCGENVCDICAKLHGTKHYCPKCYETLPEVGIIATKKPTKPRAKKPKKPRKPRKPGKPKKSRKTKTEPKSKAKARLAAAPASP